jgi:hypothetical protein
MGRSAIFAGFRRKLERKIDELYDVVVQTLALNSGMR